MPEHEVTVRADIYCWDGTELVVSCSCGEVLLDEARQRPYDQIRAVVHAHLANAIMSEAG